MQGIQVMIKHKDRGAEKNAWHCYWQEMKIKMVIRGVSGLNQCRKGRDSWTRTGSTTAIVWASHAGED